MLTRLRPESTSCFFFSVLQYSQLLTFLRASSLPKLINLSFPRTHSPDFGIVLGIFHIFLDWERFSSGFSAIRIRHGYCLIPNLGNSDIRIPPTDSDKMRIHVSRPNLNETQASRSWGPKEWTSQVLDPCYAQPNRPSSAESTILTVSFPSCLDIHCATGQAIVISIHGIPPR